MRVGVIDKLLFVVIGFLCYAYVLRFRGLSPRNINWLIRDDMQPPIGNDPTTHYLGWEFFRNGSLTSWPPGRSTLLGPGNGASVALTDSLSLLAIPLRFALRYFNDEAPFQYFGVWMLICFLLQALFAGLLLQRFCQHRCSRFIGAALFSLAPVFVYRLGYGVVHASQWIVLASLWLATDQRPQRLGWVILASISVAVNPYLTAMLLIIFLGRHLVVAIERRQVSATSLLDTTAVFGSVMISGYLVGLFVYRGDTLAAYGFGDYSANVMSLVDSSLESPLALSPSWSHSGAVPSSPDGPAYQWEGFAYLGTGVLLLALVSLILNWRRIHMRRAWEITAAVAGAGAAYLSNGSWLNGLLLAVVVGVFVTGLSREFLDSSRAVLPLVLSALVSFIVAITHQIYIGATSLRVPIPEQFLSLFDFVRVSGRLIWVTAYVAMLLIVITIDRTINSSFAVALLGVLALGIQLTDGADGYRTMRNFMVGPRTAATLHSPLWRDLASTYQHIEFVTPGQSPNLDNPSPGQDLSNYSDDFWFAERKLWADLGEFAVRNKMSLNAFYFARNPVREYAQEAAAQSATVTVNGYRDDTLYVFVNAQLWNIAKSNRRERDAIGLLDGVPILAPGLRECSTCSLGDLVPVRPITEESATAHASPT